MSIPNKPPQSDGQKPTYALVSLGCPKNLVDSERMAGLLQAKGCTLRREADGADFVVINTCGFIADARKESYEAIAEMIRRKKRGKIRGVIVAGCLAEREKEKLLAEFPEIDQVVGVFARDEIAEAAARALDGASERRAVFRPAPSRPLSDADRLRLTPRHVAYLKISEGCNRLCSFCSIPQMRGPYASKPIEQVVAEANQLADEGARELVVVAQDTSFYGVDLDGKPRLAELLDRLEQIDAVQWIRVMYLYPMHITDNLIARFAAGGKVLPYLDMPLQHISDSVLAGMRRRVTREQTELLLDRLRARIKGLVLRTTLLVGFPGETEAEFEELLAFATKRRFERLGGFAFCLEPGTHAEKLDGQVPDVVRRRRLERLLAAQQPIAFAWNESQVGRTIEVMIDRDIPREKNAYLGRSWADAPEIDGAVYVTGQGLYPGQIVPCEIVAARGYDLIGVCQQ